MNLFWKKLSGKLQSTSKFEKAKSDLVTNFERYTRVGESRDLAEYKQLYEVVNSKEFKDKKYELVNRKYKDTDYCRDLRKYNKLKGNSKLQLYFETEASAELKAFLVFKQSEDYAKLGNRKAVKESAELQRFKAYEGSKEYKNYLRFNDTYVVEEFVKLRDKVSTPEFEKENAFWANSHRWETMEEYAVEQRYLELASNPDIIFHEDIDPKIFEGLTDLELTFCDEFNAQVVSKNWESGFYYGESHKLKTNHSFVNEQQANNDGKNTTGDGEHLVIKTEKEEVTAAAWDKEKGFVEKKFEYTSDVLHSKEFEQEGGVFSAKIRCTGKLHHAFWLGGEKPMPHVNVFHFNGKVITVGNATENGFEEEVVTGLGVSSYYVYTLNWNKDELVWYINNYEVFRTKNNVPKGKLHLVFNSFISASQKPSTGEFYVDWVRVYRHK